MEGLWSFSPKSESYLQRFLTVSNDNEASESRWLEFFRSRGELVGESLREDKVCENRVIVQETDVRPCVDVEDIENYANIIENSLDTRFPDIVEECLKMPALLGIFAEKLPPTVVDKFLKHTLKQHDAPAGFIGAVYERLMPMVVSRQNARSILELLSIAFAAYPYKFLNIVLPLLLSESVNEDILLNFAKSLQLDHKTLLVKSLSEIKMDSEQFSRHLNTIYELYRSVVKTDDVQKYIYNCLYENSDYCCNDKMYGRLLLLFLQGSNFTVDYAKLQTLVLDHYSIFKKHCEKALEKIKSS